MAQYVYLTEEGLETLKERLNHLKAVRRPEVASKLQAARELGDLSENAEYDSAKEEQAALEAEIFEIEVKIRNAKIIDENEIDTSKVSVGSFVKLLDMEYNEEYEFKIVGSTESDPKNNLISNESPLGDAILGKKVGEVVNVIAPAGILKYKILDIRR